MLVDRQKGRTAMMRILRRGAAAVVTLAGCWALALSGPAVPSAPAQKALTVTVDDLKQGGPIRGLYAFCVQSAQGHVTQGPNRSPAISWSKGPAKTASYAIIVVDPDVPADFTNANKEGQVIPAAMKRRDWYHWVLVDIPAALTALPEGAEASGTAPLPPGPTRYGLRGSNDFSTMGKDVYGGYDGPCPPWNDAVLHHYHFGVYALDVARLDLSGTVTGPDAMKAMQGHVLAKGEVVGVYTLNPDVAQRLGIRFTP